ncbi:hypothetical protein ES703_64851 [subsurface metagenome]
MNYIEFSKDIGERTIKGEKITASEIATIAVIGAIGLVGAALALAPVVVPAAVKAGAEIAKASKQSSRGR